MFGRKKDDDAAHHLLNGDRATDEEPSHEVVWDQASSASDRNISNESDIWEHDPMHGGESHEFKELSTPGPQTSTQQSRRQVRRVQLETHGEAAATELDEEFQRIFSPVRPPSRRLQEMS